ncbi:hypothetical protein [Amycolatopsis sp. NPDC051128]|uniref:alpha-L-rhamnosidase-related protein n=1 Tax=Amycolatopsis sp. NPDC051128 TaxID=3155412 RepID=UPI003414B056
MARGSSAARSPRPCSTSTATLNSRTPGRAGPPPSWLYPLRRNATTIWERRDGDTEEDGLRVAAMNSFTHHVPGSAGEWSYRGARRRPGHSRRARHARLPAHFGTSLSPRQRHHPRRKP